MESNTISYEQEQILTRLGYLDWQFTQVEHLTDSTTAEITYKEFRILYEMINEWKKLKAGE